jgi:hypothetical protein
MCRNDRPAVLILLIWAAVQQIAAELLLRHHLRQVAVGRGNHAHVHTQRPGATSPPSAAGNGSGVPSQTA